MELLYKRGDKGKILEWKGWVQALESSAVIYVSTGSIEGKKVIKSTTITKGKNIGKANETSPLAQAHSELKSKVHTQRQKGYKSLSDLKIKETDNSTLLYNLLFIHLPENNVDDNGYIIPMKAQQYYKDDGSVRIEFPCYGQPKINGIRCTGSYVITDNDSLFPKGKAVIKSKKGLEYKILSNINKALDKIYNSGVAEIYGIKKEDLIFDGELHIDGYLLQDIKSACIKLNSNTAKVVFINFDLAIKNVVQEKRTAMLKEILLPILNTNDPNTLDIKTVIRYLPSTIINNDAEAQQFTDNCIAEGYEGAVFRALNATYGFGKRPQTMTKLKRTMDSEFLIVGVEPFDTDPTLGLFRCKNDINNLHFTLTPSFSVEEKKDIILNPNNYIGKKVTVSFYERTRDGLPFHIKGETVIRDYE